MIGGEFEIDLTQKGDFVEQSDTYYYASGRAALYQILFSLKVHRVWLPDYLCVSIVDAVKRAGCQVVFYELDDELDPKYETLSPDEYDAVLLIDYFGLKDLNPIEDKISALFPYSVLIEDDVQAYYDFIERSNPYVQYRFTSLRKTFAVPDGGLVYSRHRLPKTDETNTFAPLKLQAADMKYHRTEVGDDSKYLSLFERGEKMINQNYKSSMSIDSKGFFAGCNTERVKQARRTNADVILSGLKEMGITPVFPVPEDKVPLFIPVWIENRNEVRRKMFSNEIFCPVHWPLEGMNLKKGAEMAEHELSLIVDQRYTVEDMADLLNYFEKI